MDQNIVEQNEIAWSKLLHRIHSHVSQRSRYILELKGMYLIIFSKKLHTTLRHVSKVFL